MSDSINNQCNANLFFSVIVPIYKVEKYLCECVDSILIQTYRNLEILLIDDGSPDNCPQICDDYAKKDPRVRVVHKKNGGVSSARNEGLRQAKGDWILFLDGDDKYFSNTVVQSLVNIIQNNSCDLIYFPNIRYFDDSNSYFPYKIHKEKLLDRKKFIKMVMKKKCVFTVATCIISKQFLINNDLFFMEGIVHEDELWCTRVADKSSLVYISPEIFYSYRINRPGSITFEKNVSKLYDKITIVEELKKENESVIIQDRQALMMYSIIRDNNSSGTIDKAVIDFVEANKKLLKTFIMKRYFITWILINVLGVSKTINLYKKLEKIL